MKRDRVVTVLPKNEPNCGWTETLTGRKATPSMIGQKRAKWLVIGAGYSGLSTATTLAEYCPDEEIVLVDANKAGEGASSRNSGFLVDSTLNDGHLSDSDITDYESKYALNSEAVGLVRAIVRKNRIDCDWNECGKYHATSESRGISKLQSFHELLDKLEIANSLLDAGELAENLGTTFYRAAVKTQGGVMLQPAALALGMVRALPNNVSLYENTPIVRIANGTPHRCAGHDSEIIADKIIVAVNGFMPSLGIKKNRVFPLLLTAGLTRSLTTREQGQMGNVDEWGVLSVNDMGATVRYTSDKRLMIRNTVEVSASLQLSSAQLAKRQKDHLRGLLKRFPFLPDNIVEHSWSGTTCISANSANVFEQLDDNFWVTGCYNGGGIGLATLYGQQIALLALGMSQPIVSQIYQRTRAAWLPPQPFLNLGIRSKLVADRLRARRET